MFLLLPIALLLLTNLSSVEASTGLSCSPGLYALVNVCVECSSGF